MKKYLLSIVFMVLTFTPLLIAAEVEEDKGSESLRGISVNPYPMYTCDQQPFGALATLQFIPQEQEGKNIYPHLWDSVLQWCDKTLERKEKKDFPPSQLLSVTDEFLIAALAHTPDPEFGLDNTKTGKTNLSNLLAVIPEAAKKQLGLDKSTNVPTTILQLANRAVTRLAKTQKYYMTMRGQEDVCKFINHISRRSERLLRGEGSYKIGTASTAKKRDSLVKAQMLEALRVFSSKLPDNFSMRFISQTALESVDYTTQIFERSNPSHRQQMAAALISALTILRMTNGQENCYYRGKNDKKVLLEGGLKRVDHLHLVKDLGKLVPSAARYLKRIADKLNEEVIAMFDSHLGDFYPFVRHHNAYCQISTKMPDLEASKSYLHLLIQKDFPHLITEERGVFTRVRQRTYLPHLAYVQEAFNFFIKTQVLKTKQAVDFITDIHEKLPFVSFLKVAEVLGEVPSTFDVPPVTEFRELYKRVLEHKGLKTGENLQTQSDLIQALHNLYVHKDGSHKMKIQAIFSDIEAFLRTYGEDSNTPPSIQPFLARAAFSWLPHMRGFIPLSCFNEELLTLSLLPSAIESEKKKIINEVPPQIDKIELLGEKLNVTPDNPIKLIADVINRRALILAYRCVLISRKAKKNHMSVVYLNTLWEAGYITNGEPYNSDKAVSIIQEMLSVVLMNDPLRLSAIDLYVAKTTKVV